MAAAAICKSIAKGSNKSHKTEVSGASHAVYVSRAKAVAALIEEVASHAR